MTGVIGTIVAEIASNQDNNSHNPTEGIIYSAAIMDWLMHTDRSIYACRNILKNWARKYPNVTYSQPMKEWIDGINNWEPYDLFSYENLLRICPVGYAAHTLAHAIELSTLSSIPTHNHSIGIKGARAIVSCIYLNRIGETKENIKKYIEEKFDFDLTNFDLSNIIPVAIKIWLDSNTYEDCLNKSLNFGDDSSILEKSIIANLSCSICNANKDTSIPKELVTKIVNSNDCLDSRLTNIIKEFMGNFENRFGEIL